MANDVTGTDWSEAEIDLVTAVYFGMLRQELIGAPFVKAHHNLELQKSTGRSHGSIEFKFQNISAVLRRIGEPWIIGYKPMINFQKALLDGVERFLVSQNDSLFGVSQVARNEMAEPDALLIEQPPVLAQQKTRDPVELERLVRKFDPAARDERNRSLGKKGELIVLEAEKTRLRSENRADLASEVLWVAEELGDGAGYDILSFDRHGKERFVEVKTTGGYQLTQFFISENERSLSVERPDSFRLVRVYDALRTPRAFEIAPPLENWVHLHATNYRASFS